MTRTLRDEDIVIVRGSPRRLGREALERCARREHRRSDVLELSRARHDAEAAE